MCGGATPKSSLGKARVHQWAGGAGASNGHERLARPFGGRRGTHHTWLIQCWAEAHIKIARMTLTIKLDRNWSSFQLANSAPPLSVTDSAIAPSARMSTRGNSPGYKLKCRKANLFLKSAVILRKADSTLRSSQAVPHPSTNRALRRLTSEVERDPVHSTRYGRQRL